MQSRYVFSAARVHRLIGHNILYLESAQRRRGVYLYNEQQTATLNCVCSTIVQPALLITTKAASSR